MPDTIKHSYPYCGSYNITLTVTTTNGCFNTVTLTGDTVYCLPYISAPANFIVCPGESTPVQTFTSTCANGGTPSSVWFQNLGGIDYTGAPASFINQGGSNQVPSYQAIAQNMSCHTLQDTVYGVAVSGAGCIGNVVYYTAGVYPTPYLAHMNTDSACANQTISLPGFTACPVGSIINWTNNNTSIGLAANGTGNISSFSGENATNTLNIAQINSVPVANGCMGNDSSFTIIIKPIPTMVVSGASVCPGDIIPSPLIITNPANGVSYSWTVTNPAGIGMPASGTGTPIPYTAPANTSLINQTGIITFTPKLNGCLGLPVADTLTIKPTPFVNPVPNYSYCPNQLTASVNFVCLPSGGAPVFTWSDALTTHLGNIPPFVTSNATASTLITTFTVNANLNGCQGPNQVFNVVVFPDPVAKFTCGPACLGTPTRFTDQSTVGGGLAIASWSWDMNNDGIYGDALVSNPNYAVSPAGLDSVGLLVYSSSVPACSAKVKEALFINPNPTVNFIGANISGCSILSTAFTDLSTITNGQFASWNWIFGNGQTFSGHFPPPQNYSNTSTVNPVYYTVSLTVESDSGCINILSRNNYIEVLACPSNSIEQNAVNNLEVALYPNPSNGLFIVEPNRDIQQTIKIYDVNGKLVLNETIQGKTHIDVSKLNDGLYHISIISNEGRITKRLVITR